MAPATALSRLRAVGREGEGNAAASRAWKEVVAQGPAALPAILTAMDGADVVAANWLRTAFDAIAERALAAGRSLPADQLERFIHETRHDGAARRLAYEWLCRVDPKTPGRLLPGMLHDPSSELRRDAVAAVMKEAQSLLDRKDRDAATEAYRKALSGACEQEQVETIAKQLDKLGVKIDMAAHFGFVRQWLLIAPFDNTGDAGFNVAYPPEKGVEPKAVYKGKRGAEARWRPYTTSDSYGRVDLNKALGKQKGVIAYAHAVIDSPAERPIQIRAGSVTGFKILLNGKELFHLDEYHHGMEMDQHAVPAVLKAGRNELLIKVCQNEQTEDWAQDWIFQVRLCDATGVAVPFTQVPVKPATATKKGEAQ
jgi:hypothetical protein